VDITSSRPGEAAEPNVRRIVSSVTMRDEPAKASTAASATAAFWAMWAPCSGR
jgi:hypothetical protein